MKVMIVDDNQGKIKRLVSHLTSKCGLDRETEILIAQTGIDARSILKTDSVDLMILDILLPLRAEDEASSKTSIELIRDLTDRTVLKRPKHIVGLTAFDNARADVEEYFKSKTWNVIHYDEMSDEWLTALANCIDYMRGSTSQANQPVYGLDLCIITALPELEGAAIQALPWHWEAIQPLDDVTFFQRGRFASKGNQFTVAHASPSRMGMVATALLAARLIERLRPRFLAMSGICAGIKDKTGVGDVLLVDPCWDYQSGKRSRDTEGPLFAVDPHQLPVSTFVRASLEQLRSEHAIWNEIRMGFPNRPSNELRLLIGPVATGSAVLSDVDVVTQIKEQQRKLVGIEMEVYGLYAAASGASFPRPTAFALKSVSDFADDGKDDTYQTYAAYTSAQALRHFVERNMSDLVALAGT